MAAFQVTIVDERGVSVGIERRETLCLAMSSAVRSALRIAADEVSLGSVTRSIQCTVQNVDGEVLGSAMVKIDITSDV